jgi:hypothetical protein
MCLVMGSSTKKVLVMKPSLKSIIKLNGKSNGLLGHELSDTHFEPYPQPLYLKMMLDFFKHVSIDRFSKNNLDPFATLGQDCVGNVTDF